MHVAESRRMCLLGGMPRSEVAHGIGIRKPLLKLPQHVGRKLLKA
jgi:hypothetical protein